MAYHSYPAPAALRPWVACAWSVERQFAAPHLSHSVLPDSYIELIFNLGAPYWLQLASGERQLAPACYLVGLLQQPLHLEAEDGATVRTVAVRCHPWAADLLQVPAACVREPITPLMTAAYAPLLRAVHGLGAEGRYGAAAAELFSTLAGRLSAQQPALAAALALRTQPLELSIGQQVGADLAARRRLERYCRRYAGTSPKQLRRLLRFEQASHYLYAHPQASLAAVAYEFGYADQAHLTREFRQLARQSPRTFARR